MCPYVPYDSNVFPLFEKEQRLYALNDFLNELIWLKENEPLLCPYVPYDPNVFSFFEKELPLLISLKLFLL